jgi:hypothetical protein
MDNATRETICVEVLRGRATEAFEGYRVSELDQALYRKWAQEIVSGVVAKRSPFKRYSRARIRRPMRWVVVLAATIATFCGVCAFRILSNIDLSNHDTYPLASAFAGLLAIAAASIGWGATTVVSARNTKINHTLTIASERFSKSDFSEKANTFNTFFRGKRINKALIDSLAASTVQDERDALQALRYLLNFFEYVSVGVLNGELDEGIIKKTLRGNLLYYYDQCSTYIWEEQRRNPKVLENLTQLRSHFREV